LELILSAIASGGLVGAANQYACLLIVAAAAKFNLITLSPQMSFLESTWFIVITALMWLLTLAPAFGTLLSPGITSFFNAISNFISGFLVPLTSAILSLAAVGVIVNLQPDLQELMESLRFLNEAGNIGPVGFLVAGGGAVSATALTGLRALSKPAISSSTGTAGTVSAPLYATLENLGSFLLMGLAYLLVRINPWLLVALFVITIFLVLALFVYALYQIRRLKTGLGRLLQIAQAEPKAGLAIVAEFFVWGSGWMAWNVWGRGVLMLFFLALWLVLFLLAQPLFVGLFVFFPPLMPIIGFLTTLLLIIMYISTGYFSASALMRDLVTRLNIPEPEPE